MPNSVRIIKLILAPRNPDQIPIIKYKVPMSLWLVENNQRNTIPQYQNKKNYYKIHKI